MEASAGVAAAAFIVVVVIPLLQRRVHAMAQPTREDVNSTTLRGNRLWEQMIGWKEDDFRWRLHVGMTFTTFVFIYGLLAQDPDLMYLRHTHNLVPLEQRVLEVLVMFRNGYSQSALTPFTGQGHAKKIIPKSQYLIYKYIYGTRDTQMYDVKTNKIKQSNYFSFKCLYLSTFI